jgi:hypothetical protein
MSSIGLGLCNTEHTVLIKTWGNHDTSKLAINSGILREKIRFGTTDVPLSKKTWKATLFTSKTIFMANPNILLSQEQESWLIIAETMKMWPYSTGYAYREKMCINRGNKNHAYINYHIFL